MSDQEVLILDCLASRLFCRSDQYIDKCKGCQGDGTRVTVSPKSGNDG